MLKLNQTHVDGKAETVLVPVNGRLVPFHISTIKNVVKHEHEGWTSLRIQFVAPGVTASFASQQAALPAEADEQSHFIREITLKAKVATNLNNTFRLIKELRKCRAGAPQAGLEYGGRASSHTSHPHATHPLLFLPLQARHKQEDLEADLVVQEALQPIRTGKVHRLRDVNIRPTLGGKKAPGTLELHANGLRFQSARGEKLDLIFANIKLAFFQVRTWVTPQHVPPPHPASTHPASASRLPPPSDPAPPPSPPLQAAEKEILGIHFHLRHPIMIGKKKTTDVQFYIETMDASESLDNTRRSGYDPDELEEEQRQRALRNRTTRSSTTSPRSVEEAAKNLEFDIPYRELGFYGQPNKSINLMMPCVNALVELTEVVRARARPDAARLNALIEPFTTPAQPPWFVVPLSDIEIAHFERVVYGLKNFDLVLVLKDFTKPPLHINTIAMEHLDALKTWLDQCNIKFYEGVANLNWTSTMKHINEMGLEGFYDDGGWKFLSMQGSDDEDDEDPDDAESDFEPSGSEEEEESSSDDGSDFADSEEASESEGEERARLGRERGAGLGRDGAGGEAEGQGARPLRGGRGAAEVEEAQGRLLGERGRVGRRPQAEEEEVRPLQGVEVEEVRVSSTVGVARGAERPAGIGKRDVEGTGMDCLKNRGPRHTQNAGLQHGLAGLAKRATRATARS